MEKIYIETSAANYFLDNLNGEGAEATRKLQLSKGRHWFISTTVLWEVLQIGNKKDLDACLFLSSYLFHDRLLKSAAEIGIDYLEKGMPEHQILDSPFTNSMFGDSWHRACKDKSYSFYLNDGPFIEATTKLKQISKHIRYLVGSHKDCISPSDKSIRSLATLIDEIDTKYFTYDVAPLVKELRRTALLIVFLHLCLGLDLAQDVVQQYWQKKKLEDPFERLSYLLDKFPDIVKKGPFWVIANVIAIQYSQPGRSSRGAIHDGLHAVYLPFVHVFLTNDNHFRIMRDESFEGYKELYGKILHLDEAKLLRVDLPPR